MRPIDADAITYCSYDLDAYHWFRAVDEDEIAEMPTLTLDDLRPKGRWKGGTCTNCGQVDFSKPNFCPNCGADMREGETRDEVEIQAGV